jgi:hypothetical protein
MEKLSPAIQEWRDLYYAATEFKKIESWDWMLDSDIFGVQNPVNGEIGYCCILGKLGEVFALVVYLGTDGLEGYLKTQSGEILPGNIEAIYIQKCLMASFEDRKYIEKPDLEVIKRLGLKFRGKNAWPLFRNYQPGYRPWYLTKEEAKYLTLALQQAIEISLRFKKDKNLLTPPEKNHYLVRVPIREGKVLKWKDKWLKPLPSKKVEAITKPIDEVRLERIKKRASPGKGIWEVDFFYAPTPVKEGKRPFYPYLFLCVDHHSGFILSNYIARPWDYISDFQEQFLNSLENIKFIPREILVRKEEVSKLLTPISSRLKIKLKLIKRLKEVERVQAGMSKFFAQQ